MARRLEGRRLDSCTITTRDWRRCAPRARDWDDLAGKCLSMSRFHLVFLPFPAEESRRARCHSVASPRIVSLSAEYRRRELSRNELPTSTNDNRRG